MMVFITAYGDGLSIIKENIGIHVFPYYHYMSLMKCSIIDVLIV
ncbi:MAG: hypothetical protein QXR17_07665 [Candidatus Bathyarchaeia archaeon]